MDIAELGFRVDSRQADTAAKSLDRLGDQAERTERQVVRSGARTSQAIGGIEAPTRRLGSAFKNFDTRNMSMQLSQVAQQTSATGNFMQALAIQLPDMALGFGTFGIAAGAAAGVLLPLAANALMAGDNAETLTDQIGELAEAVDTYRSAAEAARSSTADLAEDYGILADEARGALMAIEEAARAKALNTLEATVDSLSTRFGGFQNVVSDTGMTLEDTIGETIRTISDEFDVSTAKAVDLMQAFKAVGDAQGPREQADALAAVREAIIQATGGFGDMNSAAVGVVDQISKAQNEALKLAATDMDDGIFSAVDAAMALYEGLGASGPQLDSLIGKAAALATNMWEAARQMAAARASAQASLDNATGPGAGRAAYGGAQDAMREQVANQRYSVDGRLPSIAPPKTVSAPSGSSGGRSSSGGGGGMSDAQREAQRRDNEMTREAERIFEDTRTAAEAYARELADLNELHKMGYLDADTFGRAVEQLDEEMQEASFERMQRGIESISDAMADAIVNGENMGQALAQVFKQMAADIISAGIQDALTQAFSGMGAPFGGGGSLLGNIFGSLFGGARAMGGPVSSGKTYLVGERGPELFTPSGSGNITPNHAMGGGGVNYSANFNVSVGNDRENEAIRRDLNKLSGEFEGRVIQTVRAARTQRAL